MELFQEEESQRRKLHQSIIRDAGTPLPFENVIYYSAAKDYPNGLFMGYCLRVFPQVGFQRFPTRGEPPIALAPVGVKAVSVEMVRQKPISSGGT